MTTDSTVLDIERDAPRIGVGHRRSRLKDLTDTIITLKHVICIIQGRFAEYAYNSYLADRDLQQALLKNDEQEIRRLYHRFNFTLNTQLERDIGFFAKEIRRAFIHKGGEYPRVCLKRPYTDKGIEKVIVISRDRDASYTNEYELQKNTGFRNVKKTGSYYICNNIPKELAKSSYDNPRINEKSAKHFRLEYNKRNHFIARILALIPMISDDAIEQTWIDAWEGTETGDVRKEDCYKSTLIIPITLAKNDISLDFERKFFPEDSKHTVFGFLCFDHHEIDYFDEIIDVAIGYILADIISYHFLTHYGYTQLAISYKSARELLHGKVEGST